MSFAVGQKGEPMAKKYIDADKLLRPEILHLYYHLPNGDIAIPINDIKNAPTADVRENVRGKWIPVTNGRGGSECNQCHAYAPTYQNGTEYNSNFCPNCGAYMRGEKNENR